MSINRDAVGPGNAGCVPGEGRLGAGGGCRLEKQTKRSLLPPPRWLGFQPPSLSVPPVLLGQLTLSRAEHGREVSPPPATLQRCQQENNKFPGIFYTAEA